MGIKTNPETMFIKITLLTVLAAAVSAVNIEKKDSAAERLYETNHAKWCKKYPKECARDKRIKAENKRRFEAFCKKQPRICADIKRRNAEQRAENKWCNKNRKACLYKEHIRRAENMARQAMWCKKHPRWCADSKSTKLNGKLRCARET